MTPQQSALAVLVFLVVVAVTVLFHKTIQTAEVTKAPLHRWKRG